jgi:hypothetical protein
VLSSQTPLKKSDLVESCNDDRRYSCLLDARGIKNIRHNEEDRKLEEGNDEVNIGYQGSPYVCALSETSMGISPRGVISWISCVRAGSFAEEHSKHGGKNATK